MSSHFFFRKCHCTEVWAEDNAPIFKYLNVSLNLEKNMARLHINQNLWDFSSTSCRAWLHRCLENMEKSIPKALLCPWNNLGFYLRIFVWICNTYCNRCSFRAVGTSTVCVHNSRGQTGITSQLWTFCKLASLSDTFKEWATRFSQWLLRCLSLSFNINIFINTKI